MTPTPTDRCAHRLGISAWLLLAVIAVTDLRAAEREIVVGNLVYAGDQSSVCFSDRFLTTVKAEAGINTVKRMRAVRLSRADELHATPFVVMSGKEAFALPDQERQLLRNFLQCGGFLLASAGCSSEQWSASLRQELTGLFGDDCLQPIPTDHAMYRTLFQLDELHLKTGGSPAFEGVFIDGRLAVLFSKEGLNDTAHTQGCCCCGGNEVKEAEQVVANVLVYALVE